jgi:hypothetical protein
VLVTGDTIFAKMARLNKTFVTPMKCYSGSPSRKVARKIA